MNESAAGNQKSEVGRPESLRGFWALIVTQFQGAFSDNVVKNLVGSPLFSME